MRVLKCITAHILLIALVFGFNFNVSARDTPNYKSEAIETLEGLGMMKEIDMSDVNRRITRAEYARLWYNINNVSNNVENKKIVVQSTFSDVNPTHNHYNAILYVASVGLMKGYSEETFGVDNPITLGEAIKVIIDFLELDIMAEQLGGYPFGYMAVARKIGIIAGGNTDTELTLDNISEIFFQLLYAKNMYVKYTQNGKSLREIDNGITFMKKYFGLEMKKGIITDNSITSMYGETRIGSGDIEIDGLRLKATMSNEEFEIGDEVKAYYNEEKAAIYVYKMPDIAQVEIALSDVYSISNGRIKFTQNNKDKYLAFKENPYVIFNGVLLNEYIWEDFLNYDKGTVRLVKSRASSVYDIIKIEAFKSFVVSGCERDMRIIYTTDGNVIKFADSDYMIFNGDGEKSDFSNIYSGNVIDIRIYDDTNRAIYKSANTKNVYKVYVSNNYKDNIKVVKKYTENGYNYVSTDDGDFKIDRDYELKPDYVAPTVGNTYSFYLNKFDQICNILPAASDGYTVGILCKIAPKYENSLDDTIYVKLFLPNIRKMPYYALKEKVRYSDLNGEMSVVKASDLMTTLTGYNGILRFMLSDKNEVSAIELPISDAYTKFSKLHTIVDSSKVDDYGLTQGKGLVYNGSSVANKALIKRNYTHVICIDTANSDTTDINRYNVFIPTAGTGIPLSNGVAYNTIKAYTIVPESPVSQYVVIDVDMSSALYAASMSDFAVVKDITGSLDEDGAECYKIQVAQITKQGTIKEEVLTASKEALKNMTNFFDEPVGEEPEIGDIIYYRTDSQGKVGRIWHAYDVDGINAAFPDGRKGTIPGTVGYFSENVEGKTNPLALKTGVEDSNTKKYGELLIYKKTMGRSNIGNPKITAGQIYNYVDGYIRLSTQDFSSRSEIVDFDPQFIVENYEIKQAVTVNIYRKKTDVLSSGLTNVRTFKEYGESCSQVVVIKFENYSVAVIYNEFK